MEIILDTRNLILFEKGKDTSLFCIWSTDEDKVHNLEFGLHSEFDSAEVVFDELQIELLEVQGKTVLVLQGKILESKT